MKYTITWEPTGTIVEFTGDINIQDINNASSELNGDERYYEHSYSIWSFSKSDLTEIHATELIDPVAIDLGAATTLNSFKQALVAVNDYSRDLCQTYINESIKAESPWQFKLFTTIDDAKKWCKT